MGGFNASKILLFALNERVDYPQDLSRKKSSGIIRQLESRSSFFVEQMHLLQI
jgi:hypothetical protein